MGAASETFPLERSKSYQAILWGGSIAGALDITAAFVTSGLREVGPILIPQAIASELLGAGSYPLRFQPLAFFASPLERAIRFLFCQLGHSVLRRWGSSQKAFSAQILIYVGPMDAVPTAAYFPVLSFCF